MRKYTLVFGEGTMLMTLRWILIAFLGCFLITSAFANHSNLRINPFNTNPINTSGRPTSEFPTDLREALDHEIAQQSGEHFSPFVYSGGVHGTSSTFTTTTFPTVAYVPERINQVATAITYAADATDICWTIISSDNDGITSWTRVGTTSYYYRCDTDTAPTLPANSAWLMQVTISGSAITAVTDRSTRQPFIGVHIRATLPAVGVRGRLARVTDAPPDLLIDTGTVWLSLTSEIPNVKALGVIGDGVADDQTAITAAIAAYNSLYFPNGTYNHSGTIDWTKAGFRAYTQSKRNVRFHHTGTGVAHTCNGGTISIPAATYGLHLGPFRITGTTNTTDAFQLINCHDWDIDITVNNVTGFGFLSQFAIGGRLRFSSTPNGGLGSSPQLATGIRLDGNSRVYNGQINNGVLGGGTPGTVLTVLGSIGNSAPLVVNMPVSGTGVVAGTIITALGTGTGAAGTYTVNNSQNVGGGGISMSDGGVTGPTNGVWLDRPVTYSTAGVGVELRDAGANIVDLPLSESNATFNVALRGSSVNNEVRGLYSNGNIVDQGSYNMWTKMVNGGTYTVDGGIGSIVLGGRTADINIMNTASDVYIRGLTYSGTFTNNALRSDVQVKTTSNTYPIGEDSSLPYFGADRLIGKIEMNQEQRTTSGAFSATGRTLLLNHATAAIVATWPVVPVSGQIAVIVNISASGTANHSVQLPAGITFDGTNNTVTLNEPNETIFMVAISATRWIVLSSVGTPTYSVT